MSTLAGKTALVTGASRGMGRASALALAKAGDPFVARHCDPLQTNKPDSSESHTHRRLKRKVAQQTGKIHKL